MNDIRDRFITAVKRFVYILYVIILIIGMVCLIANCFFEKRDYDYNYEHFLMQENGYNYCPYCGANLQEVEE